MSSGACSKRKENPRSAVSNWWEETPRSARIPSKRTRVVLDEAEIVVDELQPGVLQGALYGIDVTIEGDDAAAIV